ncbi:C3a anaphylatoxin chemotactic receptor-like [Misgurnus anguillicaudatus]|uniref:C3a anaphylatoxin chemotactic receptor-like n=1 Tax=Misgurnus anguillicaudatus TaxID=75329 RepID=UPI003CCFDACA
MTTSTSNAQVNMDLLTSITIFLLCVTHLLGVVGNGVVIYVVGLKMKKTVNTIWFLNLAGADFLFIFFMIFNIIYTFRNFDWPFGDFMCKLCSLVTVLNMFASTFLLAAISVDRCLSTWMAVWARTKRTLFKAKISCLVIWSASIACSIPLVIFRKTKFYDSVQITVCIADFPYDLATYKILVMYRFIVGFMLPFIVIFSSNLAIGVKVRRLRRNNKLKPFRIILAVILAFFFCWLPFYIHQLIDLRIREINATNPSDELDRFKEVLDAVAPLIVSLAYLNSCLNPFLYVLMCDEFQKKLKQSLVIVFESAFAEEHLTLLSQQSQPKNNSQSMHGKGTEGTGSSED